MNNVLTSIAFSIYSNKGVYALILGSGISKTAGIPTGWDIINDLIKKLAILKKEACQPDPETWFKGKYKDDPDYSMIISKMVTTASERINLIKTLYRTNPTGKRTRSKSPNQSSFCYCESGKKRIY